MTLPIDDAHSTPFNSSQDSSLNSGSPVKVWVAGATGFCGRAMVRHLASQPSYQPLAHIRPSSTRYHDMTDEWDRLGVRYLSGSWDDVPMLIAEYQPQVIISFIGTTKRQMRESSLSYHEIDYALNATMIEAAVRLPTPAHFIYLSSQGVQWARWSAYLQARADVERHLHDAEMSCTIIRPGLLHGESRDEVRHLEAWSARLSHGLNWIFSALKLTGLARSVRPLDAPEVAQCVYYILEDIRSAHASRHTVYELNEIYAMLDEQRVIRK